MTVLEFLKANVPFLNGLGDEDARLLAESAQQVSYKMGQTVLFKGATVDGLYVVASGQVAVWGKPDKRTASEVARLGPGEVFGEISILEQGTAGATIKASVEPTVLYVIAEDVFRGVLERCPDLRTRVEALARSRKPAAKPPAS